MPNDVVDAFTGRTTRAEAESKARIAESNTRQEQHRAEQEHHRTVRAAHDAEIKHNEALVAVANTVTAFITGLSTQMSENRKASLLLIVCGIAVSPWNPLVGGGVALFGAILMYNATPKNYIEIVQNFGRNAAGLLPAPRPRIQGGEAKIQEIPNNNVPALM